MENNLRSFVSGLLVGAFLFGTVAFASNSVSVDLVPINFVFDGVSKALPEGQTCIIYQGRSYVPLRFVAESVGKEVSWDSNTQTAFIGELPNQQTQPFEDEYVSYTNSEDKYTILIPKSITMSPVTDQNGMSSLTGLTFENGFYGIKVYRIGDTDCRQKADSVIELTTNAIENMDEVQLFASEKVKIAGCDAHRLSYSQPQDGKLFYFEQYTVFTKNGACYISIITLKKQSDAQMLRTKKIINSFTLN